MACPWQPRGLVSWRLQFGPSSKGQSTQSPALVSRLRQPASLNASACDLCPSRCSQSLGESRAVQAPSLSSRGSRSQDPAVAEASSTHPFSLLYPFGSRCTSPPPTLISKGKASPIAAQELLPQVHCVLHPTCNPGLDIEGCRDPCYPQLDGVAPPDNLHLAGGGG